MTAKQISVFLENRPGQLAEFTDILRRHDIDMRALSLAEAEDFGVLRIIVDDVEKTNEVLKKENYVFSVTPVIAVAMTDESGGLYNILHILAEADINLEYSYAFVTRKKGVAFTVLRVNDNEKAIKALHDYGVKTATEKEIEKL